MSNFLEKIPVSPITSFGNPSVPNGSTIGTNFSILQTGGYMEVYALSGLTYTIPPATTGIIEFSGNSIPIQFTKGSGSAFSPDVLTLNSDNISSGRRKLGMLVYVYETDKIYQFNIKNYDTLWSNATGATGPGGPTVVMSDYGTTVKNNSAAGIALINAWTTSTISGVNGYNDTNASWAILQTQSITGGTFNHNEETLSLYNSIGGVITITGFTDVNVTGGTYFQGNTTFTNSTGGTFNIFGPSNYDPGVISGGTWTDNSNGSINLPQITVALFNNPNFFEPLKFYSIPSGTTGVGSIPALLNNDTNYVIIEYNNGSPRYNVLDNDGTVDWSSVILYMIIYRADNFVHILEFGNMGSGLSSKMNDRIISTDRFARESGCSLGLSGSTGVVTLSSGVVWNGPNRQILNGVTSMGLFFKNYHSGGTWVYTTTAHTINNLYYDNGTDLVLATGGKYLVNWYFRGQELNDHLYEVVSSNQYDSVLGAEASNEPNLPELITSHAFLVGRIIIAVSATTGITQSAFTNVFQPSGASGIHNDLIGLQGGLPNEYYHLDSNKYNNLALTNTNNNFSVGQTFLSGLTASTISATTITARNISGTTNYVSKFTGANSLGNSLIYDNGTNVGIGTISPSTTLQVSSSTNQGVVIGTTSYPSYMGTNGLYVDGSFRANNYLLNSGGAINWGASQAKIIGYNPSTGSDTYLSFFTGGISANGERIRIIDNGNVGIGTTVPISKLDLGSTNNQELAIKSATSNRAYYAAWQDEAIMSVNRQVSNGTFADVTKGAGSININSNTGGSNIKFLTSNLVNTLQTEKMRITEAGNVGIGTTTPFTTLQVSGSTQVGLSSINAGSYTNGLAYVNPAGTATSLFLFQAGVASGHVGFRASDNNLYIVNSYTNGSVTNPAAITLTSTGNVGIGTTSPTAKLDVQGSITAATNLAKGVNISNNLISSANNDVLVGLDIAPNYVGGVGAFNNFAGGAGYSAGTYTNIALTGGTGTGAIATIIVVASAVTTVTITTPGSGYYLGNILSTSGGTINGVGSGFNLTVNTLSNTSVKPIGLRVDGINIGRGGGYSSSNTVIGNLAGLNNTTGGANTFLGYLSGQFNNSGSQNTFIGQNAGGLNTSGNNNINIGVNAGFANTTGVANVFLGRDAGRFITDKSTPATSVDRSIMLGYRTSPLGDSQTNQIVIGYDSTGLGSNTTVLGSSSTVTAAIYGNLLLGTTVDTGQKLQVSGNTIINGGLTATTINASNISGTTNYVSKFTGANSLGNSVVYDNGTNVGIGTTSPAAKLHVSTVNGTESSIILGQELTNRWKFKIPASSTSLVLGDVGGDYVYFLSTGNIGIGTSTPSYKLDVSGTTRIAGTNPTPLLIERTGGSNSNIQFKNDSNIMFAGGRNNSFGIGPTQDLVTTSQLTVFGATGNVVIQNGGAPTDDGINRLQVSGSSKISHTGATPLIIERTNSLTNTNIQFKNDVTSLFIGQMANSNIGIGPSQNLVASSQFTVFGGTGNVVIQNGGTPVDVGYRLDVSGTTRLNGQTRISGTTSATTNLAQGVIVNPTLVSTANNDVLVGLDIAPNYVGGVGSVNTIVGGTGYSAGTYTNIALTGGTGTGAIATIIVVASAVTTVTITTPGSGYYLGNILSTSGGTINGVGSGFNLTVNTLSTGTNVKPMGLRVDGIPIGRGGGYVSGNFAMGIDALNKNTIGNNNIGIGLNTLLQNSNGSQNIAIGNYSLQNNQNSQNTSIGYASLISLSNGSANTSIGNAAGRYIANGSTPATNINNSIFIGSNAFPLADTQTNQIVIGYGAIGLGNNTTVLGNSSTVTSAIYGNLLLGTTVDGGAKLQVSGTVTPTSTVARGASISPILTATANGDTLVGLDINPTFTTGALTGVTNAALRVSGNILPSAHNLYSLGTNGTRFKDGYFNGTLVGVNFYASNLSFASTDLGIYNSIGNAIGKWFGTGNLVLQSPSATAPTDAGYRLDVLGTTRHNGQTIITGTTSATTNLAQGTIVNPTLVATANNDVLVGMDINPTFSGGSFINTTSAVARFNGTTQGFIFADYVGYSGIFALYPKVVPTNTNYLLRSDGTNLVLNAPGSNGIYITTSNIGVGRFMASTGNLVLQYAGVFNDNGARLQVGGDVTAATNLARGATITNNLISAANNDVLVGLDIAPNYVGGVGSVNTIVGGSSYTGTSYTGVPLTGGTGTGALATVFIGGGAVTAVTITTAGSGYYLGNVLGTSGTTLGTVGSGFNLTINTLSTGTGVKPIGLRVDGINIGRGGGYNSTNTVIGNGAGLSNTTGSQNSFIGYISGLQNTTGVQNTALGAGALYSNINGNTNTAIGANSLGNNVSGYQNTTIGNGSLSLITSGRDNVSIGFQSGRYIADGTTSLLNSNTSIFIGNLTKALASSQTNQVVIGYDAIGLGNNTTVLGNSSTVTTAIYGDLLLGTTSDSGTEKLQVVGSSRISHTGATPLIIERISTTGNANIQFKNTGISFYAGVTQNDSFAIGNATADLGSNAQFSIFPTTGNVVIQNGGFPTDTGYRLDVSGTTRLKGLQTFQGTTASDGPTLGSELATTATGTNWVGTSFALGYDHTTGSTVALTSTLAAVVSTYYQIAYTITGRTAGSITITFGGVSTLVTSTGAWGPLATTTGVLTITPTTDFDGTIVLSVKSQTSTSVATTTFTNSSGTVVNEIRNASSNTNLFIGLNSGRRVTTSVANTFIGFSTGSNNTTGTNNTFIGQASGTLNSIGSYNLFVGQASGQANTLGNSDTFVGQNAGYNNTSGGNNAFFGASAGYNNTSAYYNTLIGDSSGLNNTVGSSNTFIGQGAGASNTTGGSNVLLGANTGGGNTAGGSNVILGASAGRYIADKTTSPTSIGTSILIGNRTSPLANTQTNQIVIGNDSTGLGSNTTVLGNSSTITTAIYGDLLLGTTIDSGTEKLQVQGTAGMTAVKIIGSGNSTTPPIFTVQGSQGELFSVNDSLTGSLFSVNDISGLPILEVFSDNTVLMGSYIAPSLNTTTKVTAGVGLTSIYSIPTSDYTGAFFDYTISDNTNLRAGNVMAIWNSGTTVQYTETSTNDIGNTSGLTFNMIISGSTAILRTSGVTGNWTVKTIVRSI